MSLNKNIYNNLSNDIKELSDIKLQKNVAQF